MLIRSSFFKVAVNTRGRDFVFGDLHGQVHMLERLLSHVEFDVRRDRVFGVGDLIDRGPSNVEALHLLARRRWFFCTRGNHEQLLIDTLRGSSDAYYMWRREDLAWYSRLSTSVRKRLGVVVEGMPLAFEIELRDGRRVGLIHAEVAHPGWAAVAACGPWDERVGAFDLTTFGVGLWGRRRAKSAFKLDVYGHRLLKAPPLQRLRILRNRAEVPGVDLVISGHTISPQARPVLAANQLFIDTGAYMDKGRLTLVEPLSNRCWQVTNLATNPELAVAEHPFPAPLDFSICAVSPEEQHEAEQEEERLDPFLLELLGIDE